MEGKGKAGSAGQQTRTMRVAGQSGLQAQPLGIPWVPWLIMLLNPTPSPGDSMSPSPPSAL